MKITTIKIYFQKSARINQIKNNHKHFVYSITLLRFEEIKVKREKFYATEKPIKIWDVNVNNTVISKLVKTKTNSKHLIGYLDKAVRSLILIMPKMRG